MSTITQGVATEIRPTPYEVYKIRDERLGRGEQPDIGGSKIVSENLNLESVPSEEGEYVYVYKCKVTVDSEGNKTATYSWVPLIET